MAQLPKRERGRKTRQDPLSPFLSHHIIPGSYGPCESIWWKELRCEGSARSSLRALDEVRSETKIASKHSDAITRSLARSRSCCNSNDGRSFHTCFEWVRPPLQRQHQEREALPGGTSTPDRRATRDSALIIGLPPLPFCCTRSGEKEEEKGRLSYYLWTRFSRSEAA